MVLNVKDFEATGDGITDDSTAIQYTINAAHTQNRGTVYFPAGTYLLGDSLVLYNNLILRGEAKNTVTLTLADNFYGTHISATDVSDVAIKDLTFTGPGIDANGGGGVFFSLQNSSNTSGLNFENILIQDCAGTGLQIACPIVSSFTNVTVLGCAGDAFNFYGGGTSCVLNSCYAITCTGVGYRLNQMNYMVLNGCAVEVCGIGIYLQNNCNNVSLISCGAEDNIFRSTDYPGIDYQLDGGVGNVLISCYSRNEVATGIQLNGGNPTIIGYRQLGSATNGIIGDRNVHGALLENISVSSPITMAAGTVGQSGATSEQPITNLYAGYHYYDTTLNQPIWYDGADWRNAFGTIM